MRPHYREYPPPAGLESVVACLWEQEPSAERAQLVVPDGCMDVVWLEDRELVVAGVDTGPRTVDLEAHVRSSAIRLRPGCGGSVLGLPASELRDQQVGAACLWGDDAERLQAALAEAQPPQRLELLADAVRRRHAEPDALVIAAARRLAVPGARVSAVAAGLGVGERLLHRRMLAAVGYGPKVLARVARLRRLVTLGGPLAQRALEAGYASQAHMNEEVRRLTGTTPVRYLKDAVLTAA